MSQFSDWERDYGSPCDRAGRKQADEGEVAVTQGMAALDALNPLVDAAVAAALVEAAEEVELSWDREAVAARLRARASVLRGEGDRDG